MHPLICFFCFFRFNFTDNAAVSMPTILSIITPSGGIVVEGKPGITVPHFVVIIIVVP